MLPADLKAALSGEITPKFLATLDANGIPNCVPVISLTPWENDTLVFGEFFMNKTRKNLAMNNKVGIAVIDDKFRGWSLRGVFLGFETTGPRVEWLNQTPMFRYNAYTSARAAGQIRIEQIDALPAISRTRLLRDFALVKLLARLARTRGRQCMPLRVCEKFQRLRAVRAIAFRADDGYPHAFPLMACVAAGSNRLLLKTPLLPRAEIDVAIAVITTDPVAYQVKGAHRQPIPGWALIDLNACYSASPPLLGERLDRLTP